MVVITRVGGEGADLPTDMASVVDGSWIRRVAQAYGAERGTTYYNGTYDDSLNEGNDWDKGDHFLQLSNREEDLLDLVTANFDNVILVYNGANAFQMDFLKDYPRSRASCSAPAPASPALRASARSFPARSTPPAVPWIPMFPT